MSAIQTAFNPFAAPDERQQAMTEAQRASMPSSVADMIPLVKFVQEQYQEQAAEQEFQKALAYQNVVQFPSKAARGARPGMQSVWLNDTNGNSMGNWREKWASLNFDMLRNMVDSTPVLGAVILTRIRQVQRFCMPQVDGKGPGFKIALADSRAEMDSASQVEAAMLEKFILNCGWEFNPRQRLRLKRDNFSGFMTKVIRDSLTLDSAPIETEMKRNKALGIDGMYAIDGSTIRLCIEEGYEGNDEIFALQVVDGQVRSAYTYADLIYVPRNPRADVMTAGYGSSECELLVRVVTGYLNAFTYNTSYFDKNAIPKGLLHLTGDYSQQDINAFKRYWNAQVRGINNAWALPMLVSKNQESKASFEKFGVDTSEMMFSKWMTFLTAIICAIYGIAPDEINFESFTNGTSSLSGSDTEEKLVNSKDKGLRPLLAHHQSVLSDYVVSSFGDKWTFRWTGLDEESQETAWDKAKTLMTWNEARKTQLNLDAVPGDIGDAPLNPVLSGAYKMSKQAEQEDYGEPDEEGPPGAGGAEPGPEDDPEQDPQEEPGQEAPMAKAQAEFDFGGAEWGLPVFRVEA